MTANDLSGLFKRIAKGETAAFELAFNHWFDKVYSTSVLYCKSRDMAMDIAQQVFLKLWERRSILQDVDDAEAWLMTATRYQTLNSIRKEIHRTEDLLKLANLRNNATISPEDELIQRDRNALINKAIQSLPAKQKDIYLLSRDEQLTYKEIGERLGLARETIKDYMSQALKSLRAAIQMRKDELLTILLLLSNFL